MGLGDEVAPVAVPEPELELELELEPEPEPEEVLEGEVLPLPLVLLPDEDPDLRSVSQDTQLQKSRTSNLPSNCLSPLR